MKAIRVWLVVLGLLVAVPAMGQVQLAKNGPAEPPAGKRAKETAKAAPGTTRTAPRVEVKETEKSSGSAEEETEKVDMSAVLGELQQMRQMIEAQKKELEAQRAIIEQQQTRIDSMEARSHESSATPAETPASPSLSARVDSVAAEQDDLDKRVKNVETDLDKTKKSLKGFGPFSFSGDVRVRYEPFFGGGSVSSSAPQDRHRTRYRLRFNVNAKFNDEVSGGFTVASGDPGDPISTNQTLTNFLVRKPFLVDKAFVTYKPRWFKPFSVTAGKWGYTWYRTELTFDNDLNPEGLSEQVMWDWKDRFLSHFGLVAFQVPIFEVSGSGDTAMFGGQIQTGWKLSERFKVAADVAYYHYRNADAIAANQNSGLGAFGNGASAGFGGSTFSNFSGTIGGVRAYASKFGIVDAVLRMDAKTPWAAFPLMMQFNYAQNTQACSNIQKFIDAGAAVPFCDPKQRHAYWAEVQFGQTNEQKDMRFGYTFIRVERDAVVSAFNFSDIRQATNDVNHRFEYSYQLYKNVNFGITALVGRQLRTPTSTTTEAPEERWLKRFQFDVMYKF